MNETLTNRIRSAAFTLIELMIVISIIAILAAMIFPAFSHIKKRNYLIKARAELQQLELAIGSYKTKNGYLPPSNPLADQSQPAKRHFFALNPLFFELKGTKLAANAYQTLDSRVSVPTADVSAAFGGGISGFMNCTRGGGDESASAQDYLKDFKPGQFVLGTTSGGRKLVLLTCTVQWSKDLPPVVADFTPDEPGIYPNPWRYNSSSPTNNPGHYDLWVDLIIGGKTNRVSNWSARPQIVYDP